PAKNDPRDWAREADENQSGHNREQKDSGHDLDRADDVSIKRLRVHVAVSDSCECLHTEEKAVEEPMGGPSRDAVLLQAIKSGEKKIEADVKRPDKCGELRPPQAKQPAIHVAPFPGVGVDLYELDLPGSN